MLREQVGKVTVEVSFKCKKESEELFKAMRRSFKYSHNYKAYVNKYQVKLSGRGESYVFTYHDSIHNTESYDIYPDDMVSSILSSIRCDAQYTEDIFPRLQDFLDLFGYENTPDSTRLYKRCMKAGEMINKIFSREELESLPE